MVTVVRKEYRKPYILTEGGYQDMMRTTWDRSVWNSILEVDPIWAEFLFTRADLPDAATAAEIRRLRYIKQSEFKKHYMRGLDYEEMEYLFEGFIPGIFPTFDPGGSTPKFDFPFSEPEDIPTEDGPTTTYFVCDADTDGCYCEGAEKDVKITATYPITGVEFVHGEGETIVEVTPSWGLNTVTITISTPAGRTGQMRLRVWMQLPNGRSCDSEVNIYQCDPEDCCPECDLEWNFATSVETLVPPSSGDVFVDGGTGPYTWEISSEDGKWTLDNATTETGANRVNALAGACGSATITVTDSCGCETEGGVRNPGSGSWVNTCNNCCVLPNKTANVLAWAPRPVNWTAEGIYGNLRMTEIATLSACNIVGYEDQTSCEADAESRPDCDSQVGIAFNRALCEVQCSECLVLPSSAGSTATDCILAGAIDIPKIETCFYRSACFNAGTIPSPDWRSCRRCFTNSTQDGWEWRC